MNVRDHVTITDTRGTHHGIVTTRAVNGLCTVKWDSGATERIHESELTRVEHTRMDTREALALAQRVHPLDLVARLDYIEQQRDRCDADDLHAWTGAAQITRNGVEHTRPADSC